VTVIGKRLRTLGILAALAGLAALALFLRQSHESAPPPPAFAGQSSNFSPFDTARPVPEAPFTDRDGRARVLADWKGKVVLVNFWATWCAPCVAEMPALDRLQKALGGGDFEVVAVSVDREGMKPVEPFLAHYQLSSLTPYLNPDASLFRAFGEKTLPVTYLIGRDGRAVGRMEGAAEWDSAGGKRLIRHYMDQPSEGG
jgi:thiol-disulfide isomerase/thioredoxin